MSCVLKEVKHLQIPLPHIVLATNDFDKENEIGYGGFGKVYKGQSEQYGTIAVKRLLYHCGSGQGEHEFMKEITLLSAYEHENLVSLIGFCDQEKEKILVYKHESNGSLDKHLRSKDLNWIRRIQICLDAATGLKYLHDDVGEQHRILHCDVKSANILLNEKWKAKISDLGLSKIGLSNVPCTFLTTHPCGTVGYIDPTFLSTNVLTQKCDVYSFGVVLFEVLCGRSARDQDYRYPDERHFLSDLAKKHYKNGKLDEIIHPDLRKQMCSTSLSTFSTVAYECLKKDEEARPTMSQIVEQLKQALNDQFVASSVSGSQRVTDDVDDLSATFQQRLSTSNDSRLMATSSSSSHSTLFSSSRLKNHDVFVSFRGIDVDEKFVEHLRSTLLQKGIHTYMDDDHETLHWGESISLSLCNKIKESKIVLIIFSKNYVNSWWCLNELAYVMENKDKMGQVVMPIFYHIDPLDIQKQQGEFEISKHESNINKVESWRKAVEDLSHLPGWAHKDIMNRAEFIKEIVGTISDGLFPSLPTLISKPMPSVDTDTCMPYLISQLRVGCDGVQMVGICGTWGSGKSTLASSIYDKIRHKFQYCYFLKDIRAESRRYGLKTLQEKILSNVLKPRKVVLRSIEHGKQMMKSTLSQHAKILIVLDDVDHLDHLTMLAGSQEWFGQGSRIIIISTNKTLLNAHNISIVYNVRPLYMDEAMELFSTHAFNERRPVQGFEKLSVDMVCKSGGHPSTLIRLGSFLHGKDMSEWESTSTRLEKFPDHEIVEKFKTGDDGVKRNVYSFLGS